MKKILFAFLLINLILTTGCGEEKISAEKNLPVEEKNLQIEEAVNMKIKIQIGDKIFDATLEDNPSTREFVKNLPLEVTMTELNGNEKYYRFSKQFPSADKKIGEIHSGDLMLYSSSYLVLFYKDFTTSYSYTRLGKIDNPENLSASVGDGNISIKITE